MKAKLSGQILVRMPEETEKELRRIAAKKGEEAAALLRWAAEAVINCYHETGDIPRDMELRQRVWRSIANSDRASKTA